MSIIFMTSSQKFTSRLLGNVLSFYVDALLFEINQTWYTTEYFVTKHHLVTKNNFRQSRKINAHAFYTFAMSIADMLSWLTFLVSKKVMLAMLLLLLTTWWPRSQGSCG